MKRIAVIVFFVIFLGAGIGLLFFRQQHTSSAAIDTQLTPTTPPVGIPITITIPRIHVTASIEAVGLDGQKRMDVPKRVVDAGWYNLGARPGEKGSAVIDGHLDTQTGAPAVFWDIEKLAPGNSILITDSAHKTYTFIVTEVTAYPYNQLPLQKIFTVSDQARLNLITCAGMWDKTNKNYSQRTVVYAEEQE